MDAPQVIEEVTELTPIEELPQIQAPEEPEETPEQKLTFKQRKWMKVYLQTGNATEAAMQVYDCKERGSAAVIGSENLTKLNYIDFLEEAGITDKLLADKLKEGLNSKKYFQRDKKIITTPDPIAQHKYLETGLKLKRRLVERQEVEETKTININVNALLLKVYGGTTEPTSTP